jgi:hypothetical protein
LWVNTEKRKLRTDDEIAAEKAYRKEYYLKNIEHLKEASKSRYYGTKEKLKRLEELENNLESEEDS